MLSNKTCGLLVVLSLFLGGCAQYENQRGVEVSWQQAAVADFSTGSTTRAEVMSKLGPPSQLISLGDETVLYYLYEHSIGDGLILIVYNDFNVETRYDRAVFFFDENDVLSEFATHIVPDFGD